MSTLLSLVLGLALPACQPASETVGSPHIRVDAFGWTPGAPRRAVVREAVVGHDAAAYAPGPTLLAVESDSGRPVAELPLVAWHAGDVHSGSGDRVWTVDLTALAPGRYRLIDGTTAAQSEPFAIGDDVYDDVLAAAVRMLYHQRCGVAKQSPFTTAAWSDGVCHRGPGQDDAAAPASGSGPTLDLHGGWHDAGDYGKYVNFADDAVHDLLAAHEEAPELWGDDLGLPESGNGVPDLLDEIRWELDWMLRMQQADGGVLHKLHVPAWETASPPSADATARLYAPVSASATISAAGAFAHAARVFGALADGGSLAYASTLRAAAEQAWAWLEAHPDPPPYDNAGFVNAGAEDDDHWQLANRLRAAAHLLALTGDTTYRDWFDSHHAQSHLMAWQFALVYEQGLHEGMLVYAGLPNATPAVAQAIHGAFSGSIGGSWHLGSVLADDDPYGAWLADQDTTWGSNRTRAQQGRLFGHMLRFGLDPARAAHYHAARAGYIHAFHGVNPGGHTYLTALHDLGAPASLTQTYHGWFADGTAWDDALTSPFGPAPGLLAGGPNWYYAPDPSFPGTLEPPQNQPPLKSYRDWNTSWPENSWELTECQLSYQAAYIALLAVEARRSAWTDLGSALAGDSTPRLQAVGPLTPGSSNALILRDGTPSSLAGLFVGTHQGATLFHGGLLQTAPVAPPLILATDSSGGWDLGALLPPGTSVGSTVVVQAAVIDAGAPAGVALTNALLGTVRP